ncbi:phosphotransferase [Kineococcus rhizosphaerae]|uniref:phosphotransferase n=1 Tax=Kineococcus rhizosphaerae TaxID=559628 RepID=UPI001473AD48|nr:phosphotransferase [Kineococcus rhizosphaerae]
MTTTEPLRSPHLPASTHFSEDVSDDIRAQTLDVLGRWDLPELTGPLTVTRLSGGASNVNLRIDGAAGSWALRLCALDATRWGVSRSAAIVAQRDAAALGLAPDIIACSPDEGHFLSAFTTGATVTSQYVRDAALIPLVARTLSDLKLGSTNSRWFSPFDDLRTFVEFADAEASLPEGTQELLGAVLRIEALFQTRKPPVGFCHSDLVPQNFIQDAPDHLVMVDFDYAGNGWVAFELASFACQAELTPAETEELVLAYDPAADDAQRARLELMRLVAGVRDGAWALMAEPLLGTQTTPLDGWTYQKYAANNFNQARAVIESGRFEDFLRAARSVTAHARF